MIEIVLNDVSLPESYFSVFEITRISNAENNKNKVVGLLLSCLPVFQEDILVTRAKYSISSLSMEKLGITQDVEGRWTLDEKEPSGAFLYPDIASDFPINIEPILGKYKLSSRWTNPILSVILFDCMLLPWHEAIQVELDTDLSFRLPRKGGSTQAYQRLPRTTPNKPTNLLRALIDGPSAVSEKNEIIKPNPQRLVITVSEKISPTELANYIKSSTSVKSKLELLPKTPYPRIARQSNNSLFWGHFVWAYKQHKNNHHSLAVIEKWLEDRFPDRTDIPESRVLAKYYERFIQARNNFNP